MSHIFLLQVLPICAFVFVHCVVEKYGSRTIVMNDTAQINEYESAFVDKQAVQKRAALENGVGPFASRKEFEKQRKKLKRNGKLVHISTSSGYVVRPLKHSVPYVVPKVGMLLNDLAEKFRANAQTEVRFVVTSVLRTEEDVKRLQKVNVNASSKSCHCYATTIDISYANFESEDSKVKYDDLRLALAKSLHQLRQEGRCYVKFEQKQKCYHITVR